MYKECISVIVPCYNEQESLPVFYKEICNVIAEMASVDFELLFIDDGSADGTLSILKDLAQKDQRVKYISFSRNFGKEAGLYAGLEKAIGDYVVVMDVDLQDPPTLLPQMYQTLQSGDFDCVATCRVNRKGEPPIRSFFAHLFYKIVRKIGSADMMDGARDFRMMTRQMVNAILSMKEYNRFSKGIFGWVGFKTYWLEYTNIERVAGQTKWSFWKLFLYSIEGIVNFSTIPLSIAAVMGVLFCVISALVLIFVFVRALIWGDPVSGWPSTICIILAVSGVQLFCMGIMGQYLAKMFIEVKHRPIYIVKETNVDFPKNSD